MTTICKNGAAMRASSSPSLIASSASAEGSDMFEALLQRATTALSKLSSELIASNTSQMPATAKVRQQWLTKILQKQQPSHATVFQAQPLISYSRHRAKLWV